VSLPQPPLPDYRGSDPYPDPYADPRAFTEAARNRDRRRWPYAHALWRDDTRLIETIHRTLTSLQMEVLASKARIAKGEATEIGVDGVPTNQWQRWGEQQ
jgi:hypothetical protein